MQTKILDVNVEWQGAGAKRWGKAQVKHDAGKGEKTQTIVSFKNPEVFKKVQELIGQTVEVENVKEGEFWNWKSVVPAGSDSIKPASSTAVNRVSGSNYETKEERAARQVLIVKQSSLSAAVATLSPGAKGGLDPATVLELAQRYTDWVLEQDNSDVVNQPGGIDVFN